MKCHGARRPLFKNLNSLFNPNLVFDGISIPLCAVEKI